MTLVFQIYTGVNGRLQYSLDSSKSKPLFLAYLNYDSFFPKMRKINYWFGLIYSGMTLTEMKFVTWL